jgi:hypothetical protein
VGAVALKANKTGTSNTALGNEAGLESVGSGNVFIGYNAGKKATGENELFIANNETTPWIRGAESGKKLGFYGVAPVARAAAIASPAAELAALKTAVDAIRVALTNMGITS